MIARTIREALPDIDLIYAGDTLHVPYGNRSPEAIYTYSKHAMEFLFHQGCALIIVACNTASAGSLRRLQQEYLPHSTFRDRRILGVVVPTLEAAIEQGCTRIGLIATNHTVQSNVYAEELQKINPNIQLAQLSAPLLVPMIENDGLHWIEPVLRQYLEPLQGVEVLILGCTHYSLIKKQIMSILGEEVTILSQDEIIPHKVADYLRRHPEIADLMSYNGRTDFIVSAISMSYRKAAREIYGREIDLRKEDFENG